MDIINAILGFCECNAYNFSALCCILFQYQWSVIYRSVGKCAVSLFGPYINKALLEVPLSAIKVKLAPCSSALMKSYNVDHVKNTPSSQVCYMLLNYKAKLSNNWSGMGDAKYHCLPWLNWLSFRYLILVAYYLL